MARDNRIDTLKGLLIILVVLGHVITSLDNVNFFNHAVMGLIYVFHMPLFILISGYLTKSPELQPARDMWRGVLNLLATLLVFQALNVIHVAVVGGDTTSAIKIFPFGVLWYLMSLIYWKLLLYYTPRSLLRKPALYLAIAAAISVLCGLTKLGMFLSLQRTMNFYIFFLIGYYYRQGVFNQRWWNNNILHGAIAAVLLPIIFWLYPHCGNVMNGADHYRMDGIPEKVLILACSVSMSILVFNIVRENRWLSSIGRDSLFFYVYHMFVISIVIQPLIYGNGWPKTLPFILIYTAAVIAVMLVMRMIPPFRWLTQPVFKRRKPDRSLSDPAVGDKVSDENHMEKGQ